MRFRIDSDQVDRTVFTNGTIINFPHADMLAQMGDPDAALGFVVPDPDALKSAALVFRKHVLTMRKSAPRWTPRERPVAAPADPSAAR